VKEVYKLVSEHSMDSAHFLKDYDGKCSNIHGHRWRVVAEIFSDQLINEGAEKGMIVDFGIFKNDIRELVDFYDHCLIVEKGSLKTELFQMLTTEGFRVEEVSFRPTAENLAKFFFEQLKKKGHNMKSVVVYETPNNAATYEVTYV